MDSFANKVLSYLRTGDSATPTEKEATAERAANAPKHGPATPRFLSAGQMRRMATRERKARARKTTRRYHKSWMDNKLAVATLRGQLQVVGAIPGHDGNPVPTTPASFENALVGLADKYDSIAAAVAHYESILAEKAGA